MVVHLARVSRVSYSPIKSYNFAKCHIKSFEHWHLKLRKEIIRRNVLVLV